MSNRKNNRRPCDKFTGRTKKWHRYKYIPRGLPIYFDTPVCTKCAKRRRVRSIRHTVIVIDEEY